MQRTASICLVTNRKHPSLAPDDLPLQRALERRGAEVRAAVWDDAEVRWEAFDTIVIRSTWDYHLKPAAFRRWLSDLESKGARVWNPPEVVRWNMEKTYLEELGRRGIPI